MITCRHSFSKDNADIKSEGHYFVVTTVLQCSDGHVTMILPQFSPFVVMLSFYHSDI